MEDLKKQSKDICEIFLKGIIKEVWKYKISFKNDFY